MLRMPWSLSIALLYMSGSGNLMAETYTYDGVVTMCTPTCDEFASLAEGSVLSNTFKIDTTPGGAFGDADFGRFLVEVFNPDLPPSGPVGDPLNDNPMVLDSALGVAASNGTAGTTDLANQMNGGTMLIEFLIPPFNSNGAYVVYDLATGNGQICLFYANAGCIPGATQVMTFEGSFSLAPDADDDGIPDETDNCTLAPNPDQFDADEDGHGNVCDADQNNDCIVNAIDLGYFKLAFSSSFPIADLNNDGIVDASDLDIVRSLFFKPPGPSAGGLCDL